MLHNKLIGILSALLEQEGLSIVAIMDNPDGEYIIFLSKETVLHENNIIIVMGDVAIINKMKERAA